MSARYDTIAETYAAGEDDLSSPALSALLALAGDVTDRRALDLACGHGVVARELARRGARVVGLDLSAGLLARARTRTDPALEVDFVLADAADRQALPGATFDLVVSNFGLSDIDDLDGLCTNVARLLVSDGRFVFSILHPCFGGASDVSGSWPSDTTYYDERWWRATGARSALRREVGANHRTMSTYLNTLIGHGLAIDEVREPPPEQWWTSDRPAAAVQPVYLVVSCRRVGTARAAAGDPLA